MDLVLDVDFDWCDVFILLVFNNFWILFIWKVFSLFDLNRKLFDIFVVCVGGGGFLFEIVGVILAVGIDILVRGLFLGWIFL